MNMAGLNKEELGKLKSADLIKRLKEIEEENKKEIDEIRNLIKKTEVQIERDKILESVAVPETKPVDIGSLFKEEEGLEATAKKSSNLAETEKNALYQLAQAYEELKGGFYRLGRIDEEQLARVDKLGERMAKVDYIATSKEVADLVVGARSLARKLMKYQQRYRAI